MEKILTFNLARVLKKPRTKRHRVGIRLVRELALRHGKGTIAKISQKINEKLKYSNLPKRILVKLVRKDNIVYILDVNEKIEEKPDVNKSSS